MAPPHGHHHHHHGGRAFRGGDWGGGNNVYITDDRPDVIVVDVDGDGIPDFILPRDEGAGDLFPSMGPSPLRAAVLSEDANWSALYAGMIAALTASKVTAQYTNAFTDKYTAWKMFRETMIGTSPLPDDQAAAQLDQFKADRAAWAKDLESKTGIALPLITNAPPPKPDTSIASTINSTTGLVLAGALLAGILIFGRKSG